MEKVLLNKKIGKKLSFVFGIVTAIFIIAIILAITFITLMNQRMITFYNRPYTNNVLQMEIRKDTQYIGRQILWSMTTDDPVETEEHINIANQYAALVAENCEKIKAKFDNDDLLQQMDSALSTLGAVRLEVIQLASENRNDEALEMYNGAYNTAVENMQNVLIEMGNYADTTATSAYTQSNILGTVAGILMIAFGIACTVFCIYISKVITKIITKPVAELEAAAHKLSMGELDAEITYQSEDELGNLANSFRVAFGFMQAVIADTNYLLEALAVGDFNIKSKNPDQYIGEFSKILKTMSSTVNNLDTILKQINESSEQVALGASQMAESAQSLAEGATEQAGAIEELTATVENVNNIAHSNAEQAEQSANQTKAAALEAEDGKKSMEQLVSAMNNISNVSLEIQEIIGAIEDIASQTNLLSLNASIEAARAGEAGKGFAVVADQIGKLATDSAHSAVQTRELISKALEEIKNGNDMTQATVEVLEKIIDSMKTFAELASVSRDTSIEQAEILRQIQDGIEQIASVVQTNSAAAQETSATSEELSAQSDTMKSLIEQFTLRA